MKKIFYPFSIAFLLLIIVIIINRKNFANLREYDHQVDHTREVITRLEQLSNHFKSAQIYTPNYQKFRGESFYRLYKDEANGIPSELITLKYLLRDNKGQMKLLDTLSVMINEQLPVLMHKNVAEIIENGEGWRLNNLFAIHSTINLAVNNEKALLTTRKIELENSIRESGFLATLLSFIAVIIIALALITNLLFVRRRKWLEGFLESILNTSQNGIITYKAVRNQKKIVDFRIAFANSAIKKLLGGDPDEVTGKKMGEISSFVRRTGIIEKYREVVETGTPTQFEIFYENNGVAKWLYVSLAKMEDGLTATFHDISELKNYEIELKNNIHQLEQSNNELEQYAYVASHDLQEPLRKIRTYASFLVDSQKEKLEGKAADSLNKILASAERMSILIKDILAFSSLKKQPAFEWTDLNIVLKNVLQDLDLLIVQKRAKINYDSLPHIEAIPLQMHQLFYNLLNNALKFSHSSREAIINIRSTSLSKDELKELKKDVNDAHCKIIFSDNGIGFSQSAAEQIFGLFKRLNDRQQFPGSGIGLALCKKVVDNHNGEIIAEGREAEGASFTIILPLKQVQPL